MNVEVVVGDLEADTRGRKVVRLGSLAPGTPPIFITRQSNSYYVNGAEVATLMSLQSNLDKWDLMTTLISPVVTAKKFSVLYYCTSTTT